MINFYVGKSSLVKHTWKLTKKFSTIVKKMLRYATFIYNNLLFISESVCQ